RYIQYLFVLSLVFIIIGMASGKITTDSFTYISLTESLFAILQILLIVIVLMLGVVMTLPAIIADLILLIVGWSFRLTGAIWNIVWDQLTIGWFWNNTSGSSIFFSSLAIAIISAIIMKKR
ncbi:unnamed protein product, partial [Chrysoparadoxa australica]